MSRDALRIALLTHSVNHAAVSCIHSNWPARCTKRKRRHRVCAGSAGGGDVPRCPVPRRSGPRRCPSAQHRRNGGRPIAAVGNTLLQHDLGRFDILHAQDSITGNALAELKQAGAIDGFVRTVHHLDVFDDPQLESWQERAWERRTRCCA